MKNFKQVIGLIALLLLSVTTIFAQTSISGKITDSESGEALIGANIAIKGSYSGTNTDLGGEFVLNTNQELPLTLVFSYTGYTNQELVVSENNTSLEVALISGYTTNEVVVTAQLREQALQDVPMTISVLDAKLLETNPSINKIEDILTFVPGLSGGDFTGGSVYNIRGVSSGIFTNTFENSVGIFMDGVFTGRISAAGNEFYDVERIEVLKGPQGTLFGRNTAAGAISVIMNKPKAKKDLGLGLTIGNEGQLIGDYMFNVPLSDKFRFRFAGRYQQRDGLVKATDPVSNEESELGKIDFWGNRASFFYQASDNFFANLTLSYSTSDRGGTANVSTSPIPEDAIPLGVPADKFTREIVQNGPPRDETNNFGAILTLNSLINDNLVFESISGFRRNELDYRFDPDATGFPVAVFENPDESSSFTQELRLKGKSNKVDWLAAASFYVEDSRQMAVLEADAFILDLLFADGALGLGEGLSRETHTHDVDLTSFSLYGDATFHLSDKFDITAGLRFSSDKKDVNYFALLSDGAFQQAIGANVLTVDFGFGTVNNRVEESWTAIQPRINLSYKASDNALIFGGYSRGYKPGGLNDYDLRIVEPEFNNAFEVGLKTNFADNKGIFNLTGFLYDYSDLQVLQVVNGRIGANNASDVNSTGIEVETSYKIAEGFSLGGNLAIVNAEYDNFQTDDADYSGNQTIYTPKTTWRLNAAYNKPMNNGMSFYIQGDYNYTGDIYFHESNADWSKADAYGLLNAALGVNGIANGKLDIGLFANNITDKQYIVNARDDLGDLNYITRGFPFTVGITLKANNLLR